MNILKCILLILLGLVAALFIIPIFLSKDYAVERSITINKPKAVVYDYIKYLKNQDNYSRWASMDTTMKKTFTGIDGTIGCIAEWDSKNDQVGKGSQKIIGIAEGQKIEYSLMFEKPMKDEANAFMATENTGENATLVKWNINGHMKYPFNIMGLFMNNMLGKDLDIGLANLKNIMEK
jgi:hypothetical protein